MPPPITYKTVTGTYVSPDGSAVAGTVRFVPSSTVVDAVGEVVVAPTPVTVALSSGAFSVALPCTDVAGTTPTGWYWQVSELFAGGRETTFSLPTSAPSTVDLSTLSPVTDVDETWAYATLATVAALDARVTTAEDTVTAAEAAAAASATSAAAAIVYEYAEPGRDVPAITTATPVSVAAGPTTLVSGPSSGRRIVKSLWMSGPADATVTLTVAGTTLCKFTMQGGIFTLPATIPLANGETLQATVTSGPVVFMPTYADRADTVVDRFGITSGSTSGTLVAAGAARVITQLWVCSTSLTAGATATLTIGGTTVMDTVGVAAGSLLTLDDPIVLPVSTALTWTGDGATAVSFMAVGRSI